MTGCLLLVRLADWRALGGFDERFFMYGEDAELCLRAAAETGRGCAVTPDATMIHAVGASSATRPDKHEMLLAGRITLVRTHWGPCGAAPAPRCWSRAWASARRSSAPASAAGSAGATPTGPRCGGAGTAGAGGSRPAAETTGRRASTRGRSPTWAMLEWWTMPRSPGATPSAGAASASRGCVKSLLDPRGRTRTRLKLLHYFHYTHVGEVGKLTLGREVRYAPNVSFANAERITIGDRTRVGARTALWAGDHAGAISIGSDCNFGPNCFVTASNYGIEAGTPFLDQAKVDADIVIGDDVWFGTGVVVLAGVTIGSHCVIAAGSVVTRDLPPNSIVGGVPAKVIRER